MKLNTYFEKRRLYSDRFFDAVNIGMMLILLIIFIWPIWFVVIASFSEPTAVNLGKVLLIPVDFTLNGYKRMFEYEQIWEGYANTIFYTTVGTFLNMTMSICLAYPLSEKSFKLRNVLTFYFMFTMYFSGGLVPTYLLYKNIGIVNTRWAMLLPGMVSVYNSLIIRSFFMNSIPGELKEAAKLDGANTAQYLIKIVMPLSKAVFAVVGLYYMVGHWNNYTKALYYLYDTSKYPLQMVLRELLMSTKLLGDMNLDSELMQLALEQSQLLKYCVIIAAALPMLCIYPFIQKYFVKGVMVGAVKG